MKLKSIKQRRFIGIVFALLLLITISTGIHMIDSVWGHMDEVMELVCLVYILIHIKSKETRKLSLIIGIWIIMVLDGLCGSLLWRKQGIVAIAIDMIFICSKFMVAYLAGYIYCC